MWSDLLEFSVDNEKGNFVGLRREGGRLVFVMPKGCDALSDRVKGSFDAADEESRRAGFDELTQFFFKTYRALQCFYEHNRGKSRCKEAGNGDAIHAERVPRAAQEGPKGQSLEDIDAGEDGPALFYSKLPWVDDIMRRKDELEYSTLAHMPRRSVEVNYSQLHLHLHHAVFLDTDTDSPVAYLPEIELPQPVVLNQATDLVRMLCFFYEDIAHYLPHYEVTPRIAELAAEFRDRYLTPSASLFDYHTHRLTLLECRKVLEQIDQNTGYKSEEYYEFYEAAERFLYGANRNSEDGKEWGIENFSFVWEDICHSWLLQNQDIQFAHTEIRTKGQRQYNHGADGILYKPEVKDVFTIRWNQPDCKRTLKPDCVYAQHSDCVHAQHSKVPKETDWYILDLKYWDKEKLKNITQDDLIKSIIKQQMYQGCLQSYLQNIGQNEFKENAFVRPDIFEGDPPIRPVQNGERVHGIANWHGDFLRLSECYVNLLEETNV